MKKPSLLIALVVTACVSGALLVSTPAFAKGGKGGKHKEQYFEQNSEQNQNAGERRNQEQEENTERNRSRIFQGSDLDVINGYLKSENNCPPGLAKKHNGCLPPGQAKKYSAGMIVDRGIAWQPLPAEIVARLTPPPHGAMYVQVDRDVLLVTEATRKVLDAVTLLSAVK